MTTKMMNSNIVNQTCLLEKCGSPPSKKIITFTTPIYNHHPPLHTNTLTTTRTRPSLHITSVLQQHHSSVAVIEVEKPVIKKKQASAGVGDMAGNGVFAEILEGEVFKYYADGEWKVSASGKAVAIVNPTTRKTQYKVQGN